MALIAGPTASGKSALALQLAERIGGTIVNADASQLYRDLRVLSARPSVEEEARAPHRLFGHVDGALAHNAAAWAAEAKRAIAEVHAAGGIPILVGGTGLYIRTLLDGIASVPEIAADIRAEVRALPTDAAYAALTREDAAAATRLLPSDTTRIARALEVVRATGRTLSNWQADRIGGVGGNVRLVPVVLLPDRNHLTARIDARFEAMLADGAIAEVETLLMRNLDPMLPVMRAIGVREIADWRAGVIDRDAMIDRAQAASRQYSKRQQTWFRHQMPPETTRMEHYSDYKSANDVISCLISALTR